MHHPIGDNRIASPPLASTLVPLQNDKVKAILNVHLVSLEPTKTHRHSFGDGDTYSSDGCHWRPPDPRKFKLNMDATWNDDSVVAGGLI